MYGWIWRHLPGGLPGKLVGSLALLAGALALLFLLVFPWAEVHLPINHVTIDRPASTSTPAPGSSTP